jgi:hypothetical protein
MEDWRHNPWSLGFSYEDHKKKYRTIIARTSVTFDFFTFCNFEMRQYFNDIKLAKNS